MSAILARREWVPGEVDRRMQMLGLQHTPTPTPLHSSPSSTPAPQPLLESWVHSGSSVMERNERWEWEERPWMWDSGEGRTDQRWHLKGKEIAKQNKCGVYYHKRRPKHEPAHTKHRKLWKICKKGTAFFFLLKDLKQFKNVFLHSYCPACGDPPSRAGCGPATCQFLPLLRKVPCCLSGIGNQDITDLSSSSS